MFTCFRSPHNLFSEEIDFLQKITKNYVKMISIIVRCTICCHQQKTYLTMTKDAKGAYGANNELVVQHMVFMPIWC